MSKPTKRTHGRERDATQLASNGPIANKSSADAPRHCSRLVCTEVRHREVEPTFSATPHVEALRVLLCVACQEDIVRVENPS